MSSAWEQRRTPSSSSGAPGEASSSGQARKPLAGAGGRCRSPTKRRNSQGPAGPCPRRRGSCRDSCSHARRRCCSSTRRPHTRRRSRQHTRRNRHKCPQWPRQLHTARASRLVAVRPGRPERAGAVRAGLARPPRAAAPPQSPPAAPPRGRRARPRRRRRRASRRRVPGRACGGRACRLRRRAGRGGRRRTGPSPAEAAAGRAWSPTRSRAPTPARRARRPESPARATAQSAGGGSGRAIRSSPPAPHTTRRTPRAPPERHAQRHPPQGPRPHGRQFRPGSVRAACAPACPGRSSARRARAGAAARRSSAPEGRRPPRPEGRAAARRSSNGREGWLSAASFKKIKDSHAQYRGGGERTHLGSLHREAIKSQGHCSHTHTYCTRGGRVDTHAKGPLGGAEAVRGALGLGAHPLPCRRPKAECACGTKIEDPVQCQHLTPGVKM
eukprot:scaffold22386_cov118-Isochrysis_galbana.AAC.2